MSVFRQPEDLRDDRSCERSISFAERCTERVVERSDTWQMAEFNEARKEWAGSDPVRLKQMAAMFLAIGCDWEYEAVAVALGYADRSVAHNAAKVAIRGIRTEMAV